METAKTQKHANASTRALTYSASMFEKALDVHLVILEYPDKNTPYYICEHTSITGKKTIHNVYVY